MTLTLASRPTGDGARAFIERFARKRDLGGLGPVLARSGALEARLAATGRDVRRAQRLRYRVFFEEGGAIPDPARRLTRRDLCPFDAVSDHLIVVDRTAPGRDGSPKVVGVYRLLRQDVAERNFGFYSSGEFDVDALVARRPGTRFLEVGRACVAQSHRGGRVLELLWRGLWAYARHHAMDAMIGCASLPGADPAAHVGAIRLLAAGGDPAWRVRPRRGPRGRARRRALGPLAEHARAHSHAAAARQRLLAARRDLQPAFPPSISPSARPTSSSSCRSATSGRAISSISASRRSTRRSQPERGGRGIPFRAEFGYGDRRPPIRRRPTMRP